MVHHANNPGNKKVPLELYCINEDTIYHGRIQGVRGLGGAVAMLSRARPMPLAKIILNSLFLNNTLCQSKGMHV